MCNTIQYIGVYCSPVQCSVVQCNAMQCSAVQCNSIHCSAVQCWSVFKLANCAAAYPSPSSVVWEDFLHLTVGNCFTILTQWENYFTVLKQINLIVFTDTTNGNLVSSTIYHSYFNLKKMSPPHAIVFWRSSVLTSLPPSLPSSLRHLLFTFEKEATLWHTQHFKTASQAVWKLRSLPKIVLDDGCWRIKEGIRIFLYVKPPRMVQKSRDPP